MYQFQYKCIETQYDNCAKLLFTDTDSLGYEIKTNDVYEDFHENKNLFDFSEYSEDFKIFHSIKT